MVDLHCISKMATVYLTLLALVVSITTGLPVKGPVPLTPEQVERLKNWTVDDKQNIWELSGQYQGDIVLRGDEDDMERNGIIDTRYRWPNNELPYELSTDFNPADAQTIQQAIETLNQLTCVKLRPKTEADADYVYVTGDNTSGCHSQVGRIGGRQQLNLISPNCILPGIIQHEFLHALGFYHQQSSPERDDYVTIYWNNIQPGQEYNFVKYGSDQVTSFGIPYDYGSVMHYSSNAFSVNGQATMIPKDPNAQIGQINGLSDSDIAKLRLMYGC